MNRLSRDAWLALILIVLLVLVGFAIGMQQTQGQRPPPYASFSSAPDGTLALARWMKQMGFDVSGQVQPTFGPPDGTGLILMLEPTQDVADDEWATLDKWVTDGGTLLLAGDGITSALAINHYRFTLGYFNQPQAALALQAPLLVSPPVTAAAAVHATAYLTSKRTDFVTHLAASENPVLVSLAQGKGRLLISTAPFPFSNQGLKDGSNPPLVLNLVTSAVHPGAVWFDEWHHGVRPGDGGATGPEQWLITTLGGRSLLYAALVIFLALLLQGRAFGKPLPLARERARRAPLEYITAIANLNRRAGHRRAMLEDYHHRLKRELGRRYRLSPSMDDQEFVRQIAVYRPDLDAQDLFQLLTRLQGPVASEGEMVELSARVSTWLDERSGSPV